MNITTQNLPRHEGNDKLSTNLISDPSVLVDYNARNSKVDVNLSQNLKSNMDKFSLNLDLSMDIISQDPEQNFENMILNSKVSKDNVSEHCKESMDQFSQNVKANMDIISQNPKLSMNNISQNPKLSMDNISQNPKLTMDDIIHDPSVNLHKMLTVLSDKKKNIILKPKARLMNKCAPWWYFIVATGVAYWGITEVLPVLYKRRKVLLLVNQLFGLLVFLELAINWICIRYVDSTYRPEIHGVRSPECAEKEKDETVRPKRGRKVYKMFVSTSLPDAGGNVDQSAVPYWSWVTCVICKQLRPPRCHHCTLCNRCILKRDHHCFFAQTCIGVNNLRHFAVFLFWAFIGCFWSWLNMLPYFLRELLPGMSYLDILTPYCFIRFLLGYQEFLICVLTFLGWMLTVFLVFTGISFLDTVIMMLKGVTTFEYDNDIEVTDSRTKLEKLHSVFGNYWLLNFIFPCHRIYKPLENAVEWPNTSL